MYLPLSFINEETLNLGELFILDTQKDIGLDFETGPKKQQKKIIRKHKNERQWTRGQPELQQYSFSN